MVAAANSWTTDALKINWLFGWGPQKQIRNKRIVKIAENLSIALRSEPRREIALAQSLPIVLTARRFLKQLPAIDPRIAECRKELTALKLGLNSQIFDTNKGFQQFVEKNALDRYLLEYNHPLQVDPITNKISILSQGILTPWNERLVPNLSKLGHDFAVQPWVYGQNGVQNENMYDWSELKPFKKDDPAKWGHRYVFEFCVCSTGSPRKTGDHSWLRLKTSTGNVYSVGLNRPEKQGVGDNLNSPMRLKRGYLMSPDVSEFWPTPIQTISVEITEKQFNEMKSVVEADKKEDQLIFQLMQSNCVLYTKKIAKIAGVDLPTAVSIARLVTPKKLEQVFDVLKCILPVVISKVCEFVVTFFFNVLQLILGAGKVDKLVLAKNRYKVIPHISSFWDLFKKSKASINHPNTLGHHARLMIQPQCVKKESKLVKTFPFKCTTPYVT